MGPIDKDKRTALGPNNGRATAFNFIIDLIGPFFADFSSNRFGYILIMVDLASRYTDTDSSRTIPVGAVAEP